MKSIKERRQELLSEEAEAAWVRSALCLSIEEVRQAVHQLRKRAGLPRDTVDKIFDKEMLVHHGLDARRQYIESPEFVANAIFGRIDAAAEDVQNAIDLLEEVQLDVPQGLRDAFTGLKASYEELKGDEP